MVAAGIRFPTSLVGDWIRKLGVPLPPTYYRSFSANFLLMIFFVYASFFVFSLVRVAVALSSVELVRIAKALVAEPLLLIASASVALLGSGIYWHLSRKYKLTRWRNIEVISDAA